MHQPDPAWRIDNQMLRAGCLSEPDRGTIARGSAGETMMLPDPSREMVFLPGWCASSRLSLLGWCRRSTYCAGALLLLPGRQLRAPS